VLSYFDRDGQPIDALRWGQLSENTNYRFVARDGLRAYDLALGTLSPGNVAFVITIWIGFDPYTDKKPPLIFESKAFCLSDSGEGIVLEPNSTRRWVQDDRFEERRYSSAVEALRGHFDLLDRIRQSMAIAALRDYEHSRGVV
jgi:hypothetical protein